MKKINGVLSDVCDQDLDLLQQNPTAFWDGVTEIGRYAFCGCKNLTTINIPNSVTKIRDGAFYSCERLTTITIPDCVTEIEERTFFECYNLKNITIPSRLTKIGVAAFMWCKNLRTLALPDGVTQIGDYAFSCCKELTNIVMPKSITQIGEYAFNHCSNLTSITIPDGVTHIGKRAFYECLKLTTIALPDSVTHIGDNAFNGCENLSSITISKNVESIGSNAFYKCSNLKFAIVPLSIQMIGAEAFPRKSTIIFSSLNRDYKVNTNMIGSAGYSRLNDPKKNSRQIYLMSKNIPYYFAGSDVELNSEIFNNVHAYNEILKEYVDNSKKFSMRNLNALIHLGACLGLFSNQTEKKKDLNGIVVETPFSELAKKVIKDILIKVPFQNFDEYFGELKLNQFSPNFLKYLSNKNNLKEIIQNKGTSLQEIYNKCIAKDKLVYASKG